MTAPADASRQQGAVTAIVTGGGSGIGRALALALAESGRMIFIADRQLDRAEEVAGQIRQRHGLARAVALDVRDRREFDAVVQLALATTGRVDYLFNNAGIGVLGRASHYSTADWSEVIDVNLTGVCHGVAAVYPHMIARRAGHIVNVASLAGLLPAPLAASYTASKFAVVGLSRALRIEAARHEVGVTVVCPFIVDTPLIAGRGFSRFNPDVEPLRQRRAWLYRLAVTPEQVAARVLRGVARNRAIVLCPGWARILWQLDRVSPWASERLCALLLGRALQEQK